MAVCWPAISGMKAGIPGECFARLTDSGEFTLDGAMVALQADEANPIFDFDNFHGKITIIGACPGWDNPKNENRVLQVKGDGAEMKLLFIGHANTRIRAGSGILRPMHSWPTCITAL